MTIAKLFTVKDVKAEYCIPPFTARTRAEAIRMFTEDVNSGKSQISRHPADFMLICVGEFDSDIGSIIGSPVPDVIGLGVDFLMENNEPALPCM